MDKYVSDREASEELDQFKKTVKLALAELRLAWKAVEHVDFSDHMHKAEDALKELPCD